MELEEVREYAKYLHRKQQYDQYPYSFHLQSVELAARFFGYILHKNGYEEEIAYKAAWLHDSIEDIESVTVRSLLSAGIEPEVVAVVFAVTDGEGKNRKERKEAMFRKCTDKAGLRNYCDVGMNTKESQAFTDDLTFVSRFVKLCDRIANLEHSIKTGSALAYMYRKEHEEFQKRLRLDDDLEPMWKYLDVLFSL